MKKIVLIIEIIVLMTIVNIQTYQYEPVTSTTQIATNYLQPRPGSNKTSQTLTLTQLSNFTGHVRNFLDVAYEKLYDIDYETLNVDLESIEVEISSLSTSEFENNYSKYYSIKFIMKIWYTYSFCQK
jgi:hypothetical protein